VNIYTRITVPLSKDDFVTLRDAAAKEYRDPRQHAAWLLRQVLRDASEQHPEGTRPPQPQSQQPVAA
jgi:hypothetical protein